MDNTRPVNVPESGTLPRFKPKTRVCIVKLQITGTVLSFENGLYQVRVTNKNGSDTVNYFSENELLEQPELPFGEALFNL